MVWAFLRVPFERWTHLTSAFLTPSFVIEKTDVLALAPDAKGPSASTANASASSPSSRIG
jgi:hypothetical protein